MAIESMRSSLFAVVFCLLLFSTLCDAADPYDINAETYETEVIWFAPIGGGYNLYKWNVQVASFGDYTYVVYCVKTNGINQKAHVAKIDQNGQATVIKLGDADGVTYNPLLDKHNKFSIGIDEQGYIHVIGDMHNYPFAHTGHLPAAYQSGVTMYWRSSAPEDISNMTWLGSDMGAYRPTYPSFLNDNEGCLYYTSRGQIGGGLKNAVTLGKYNVGTKTWTTMGASGSGYSKKRLMWENDVKNGTSSYARTRGWGVADSNNMLHFIATLPNKAWNSALGNVSTDVIYARSSDNAVTWTKANGDAITLPMRAEAGVNQGDIIDTHEWIATDSSVAIDQNQNPFVQYKYTDDGMGNRIILKGWTGSAWVDYTDQRPSVAEESFRIYNDAMGVLIIPDGNRILRSWHPGRGFRTVSLPWSIQHIDRQYLRLTGNIQGVGAGEAGIALYRVKVIRPLRAL